MLSSAHARSKQAVNDTEILIEINRIKRDKHPYRLRVFLAMCTLVFLAGLLLNMHYFIVGYAHEEMRHFKGYTHDDLLTADPGMLNVPMERDRNSRGRSKEATPLQRHSLPTVYNFSTTHEHLRESFVTNGDRRMQRVVTRLLRGQGVRILLLGGSSSLARTLKDYRSSGSFVYPNPSPNDIPNRLQAFLEVTYRTVVSEPCI